MRWRLGAVIACVLIAGPGLAGANARPLEQLPQDVWNIATEPFTSVARETRRFDPISSLWFGLLESSIKSVQRTAALILRSQPGATTPGGASRAQVPIPL